MNQVSLVRCQSYERSEVEQSVRRAVNLVGGFAAFVKAGDKVLLKPNLLSAATPEKGITTHPEILRAMIIGCQEQGAIVSVGDSPGFGKSAKVAARAGLLAVCEETGATFTPFEEAKTVSYPGGKLAKHFLLAEEVVATDKLISLGKLKTHAFTMCTGAVKNLYGTIVGPEKARLHFTYQKPEDFGQFLFELCSFLKPTLSLIDAVIGMEGMGPSNGTLRKIGLVLAGPEAIAVDTVGAAVIGLQARDVTYLAAALRAGSAAADLQQIEILGEELAAVKISGFALPPTGRKTNFPAWIENSLRRHITAKPSIVQETCIGCGICRDSCPPQAIAIVNRKAAIDYSRCIRCYCCQEMCPQGAVALRHSRIGRLIGWK